MMMKTKNCCKWNLVHKAPTRLCLQDQWVTFWVKRLLKFDGQVEGMASPQDELLQGDLAGAVFVIVGFNMEVHLHKDLGTNRYEQVFS